MSVYGCPEPDHSGWRAGYINMTFKHSLTEDLDAVKNARKSNLLGPFSENVVQLNFCYKLQSDSNITLDTPVLNWPAGDYGVYRAEGNCPKGNIIKMIVLHYKKIKWLPYRGNRSASRGLPSAAELFTPSHADGSSQSVTPIIDSL